MLGVPQAGRLTAGKCSAFWWSPSPVTLWAHTHSCGYGYTLWGCYSPEGGILIITLPENSEMSKDSELPRGPAVLSCFLHPRGGSLVAVAGIPGLSSSCQPSGLAIQSYRSPIRASRLCILPRLPSTRVTSAKQKCLACGKHTGRACWADGCSVTQFLHGVLEDM